MWSSSSRNPPGGLPSMTVASRRGNSKGRREWTWGAYTATVETVTPVTFRKVKLGQLYQEKIPTGVPVGIVT